MIEAPKVYTQRRSDGLSEEEWLSGVRAWNTSIPHLGPPSPFDPSGLVPYPCEHGLDAKPKRYPSTRHEPWKDSAGDERPPYGGTTWGRSKYLEIIAFGARDGVPYAIVKCPVCRGEPRPADMTTPADE